MRDEDSHHFEDYREYLRLLAQLQIDRRLQAKIDLSGVVQQTLLEAYQASPKRTQQSDDHLAAWLRRILANNLSDEIRKFKAAKRDLTRERSLDAALEQSSIRLKSCLAASQTSPSHHARAQETATELSTALAKLPAAQREALIRRHLHGESLAQIAQSMGRTHTAVAGLLKRGLQQLRERLPDWR